MLLNNPSDKNYDFNNAIISLDSNSECTKDSELKSTNKLEENKSLSKDEFYKGENIRDSSVKTSSTLNPEEIINKILCFIVYLKPYFKLNSNDVKKRILTSFNPIKKSFFLQIQSNPDLYGPFWIFTTLVFILSAAGAMSQFLKGDENNYFQNFISFAFSLVYIFGFGFPLVIVGVLKFYGEKGNYLLLLCLYGYSFSCFVPVTLLCSCGINAIQWILLFYAIFNSSCFFIMNINEILNKLEIKMRYILLGIISSLQFILLLVFKLYFFSQRINKKQN